MAETALSLDAALEFGDRVVPALEASLHAVATGWPLAERLRGAAVVEVAARLRAALAVPLPEVLAAGWRGVPACLALCGQPPGETATLELAEHAVRWAAAPAVELAVGGAAVAEVAFRVEVEVRVRAGVLVVEGGRFARLHAAALEVAATLALEGARVAEWSRPLPVPGTLAFGDGGLPICPEPAPGAVGSSVSVPAIAP